MHPTRHHRDRWNNSRLFDIAVTMVCCVVALSLTAGFASSHTGPAMAVAAALCLVHTLPVVSRRTRPSRTLGVMVVSGVAYGLWFPLVGLGIAVLVGVYSSAAYSPRRTSLIGLAATVVALGGLEVAVSSTSPSTYVVNIAVLGGAWLLGDGTRRRRDEAAVHAERADQLAVAREELARNAVTNERIRIARELHDVVAHSMSVIAIQAGTGRLAFDREPDQARAALGTIESICRTALSEMRLLLGVLRSDDSAVGVTALTPAPSLSQLDQLVSGVVRTGVPVEVRIDGRVRPLPQLVDLTAYRIVQEALTNIVKHAAASRASATVTYNDHDVTIDVRDTAARDRDRHRPSRPASPSSGVGLIGMRERVALCGGNLEAGPTTDGFRVLARLPTVEVFL